MKTIQIPSDLLNDVVDFVDVSSLTMKKALSEVAEHRQAQQKAAALVEPLLETMKKAGVLAKGQEKVASNMLSKHSDTIELLKAAVDKIVELRQESEKKASDLGRPEGGESSHGSGFNSLTSNVIGGHTRMVKESDKCFMKLAGMA